MARSIGARDLRATGPLTSATRDALPKSEFGLPGRRAYPMPDRAHAGNAKARAAQAVKAGRMSKSTESKIDAKANRKLGKTSAARKKRRGVY
ncbi:MAG TPA: hypothetical protein VF957_23465 [Bradyrhizobium sp.]